LYLLVLLVVNCFLLFYRLFSRVTHSVIAVLVSLQWTLVLFSILCFSSHQSLVSIVTDMINQLFVIN